MSWTKRKLIEKAFAKIGLRNATFDLEPEEITDALTDLEAMMSEWSADGIDIGWPSTSMPVGDVLDDETGIPAAAALAIYTNLAILIAPEYGKTPSKLVVFQATRSKKRLNSRNSKPPKAMRNTVPAGQGHRRGYSAGTPTFLAPEQDKTITSPENEEVDFERG